MPFHPVESVLAICRDGPNAPPEARRAAEEAREREFVMLRRSGKLEEYEIRSQLDAFLRKLPNAEEQEKIVNRLREIASAAGVTFENLRWWDIMPGELWLFADTVRDGRPILVSLTWKDVKKGSEPVMIRQHDGSWARDLTAPNGWRYEFVHSEYHTMIAHVIEWLSSPLTLPPGT